MIAISSAQHARGYSAWDHLLDDAPLAAMAGRSYRDMGAAARAAAKLTRGTQDRRCAGSPFILTDSDGNGWTYWGNGERA